MSDKPGSLPSSVFQFGAEVPTITPSTFAAAWTSNDCFVLMGRPDVGLTPGAPGAKTAPTFHPIAVLQVSPQSAKDLCLILKEAVEGYERVWGEIHTDFTRQQAAAAAK